MTNEELRDAAVQVLKQTVYGYRIRPHSPKWNEAMGLLAQITDDPPPPPPPPPPQLAPQTYNKGSGGQDARYCIAGLPYVDGAYLDGGGYRYDENGLSLGGRSGNPVPGLKPADMMDQKGACDPYEWMGNTFPPYPAESYDR